MSTYYSGKTVLVTGASSGIGMALSRQLAKEGAKLVLIARNIDALNSLKMELDEIASIAVYTLDISDSTAVKIFASEVDIGSIDILINNAGIVCCDHFENLSEDDFRSMIHTNYLGQVWMTKAILPAMKARSSQHRNKGQIVNIASMAGVIGIAGYTAYSASKYALVGFSESLRNELAGTGIELTLVLPSDVDTPQFHQENLTKPEATKALSGSIQPISAELAASKVLLAVKKSKHELVLSPASGRLSLWLCRVFPKLSRKIMDNKTIPFNR